MYKLVDRFVSVLLITLTLILFLTACGKGGTESPAETVTAAEQTGIYATIEKYEYEGNDLVIMHVENRSDNDYFLRINGHYYDEKGSEKRSEVKTFEGFGAGDDNYFIFKPGFKFKNFTYEITTEKFDGIPYAKYLEIPETFELMVNPHNSGENGPNCPAVYSYLYPVINRYDKVLYVKAHIVMINGAGDIQYIDSFDCNAFPPNMKQPSKVTECYVSDRTVTVINEFEIPQIIKDAKGFMAVTWVSTKPPHNY